jgi:AcrR family transcriptional regulator
MATAIPDPAPSRRERRRRELHERIIQSAIALFQQKGFDATTALEIANHADVAEKTFYNHFPTKQHLIQELAARTLGSTVELIGEVRKLPGTTTDQLCEFAERAAEGALGSRELIREVLLELVRFAQVDGIGAERKRALHHGFRALFEDGVVRGDVVRGGDLEFVTDLAVATYLGIIINWVTLPDYPLRDRLRLAAESGAGMLGQWPPHHEKGSR